MRRIVIGSSESEDAKGIRSKSQNAGKSRKIRMPFSGEALAGAGAPLFPVARASNDRSSALSSTAEKSGAPQPLLVATKCSLPLAPALAIS